MYAFQSLTRIYAFILLCLCAAVLFVPSLANASNQLPGYWSMADSRWISEQEMEQRVQRELKRNIYKPSNSTLSTAPSEPTFSKNAGGGLSQTSQTIIRNMGYPSTFSTTSNYSLAAARNALGSCLRSPACAGRALGSGLIIYEGIQAWQEVYDFIYDEQTQQLTKPDPNIDSISAPSYPNPDFEIRAFQRTYRGDSCPTSMGNEKIMRCEHQISDLYLLQQCSENQYLPLQLVGLSSAYFCQYANDNPWELELPRLPLTQQELDNALETYEPQLSDAPIVLLSGEPASLTLSTPSSVELPATTTTSTNSLGETETTVTNSTINYNVTNNNTSNPSINSTLVENKTVYNDFGTVTNTSTTSTTSEGVQGETSAPLEFELPSFCSWAESLCNWLNWTKEPLNEEEPDLAVLISEFEPDEGGYSSGIGSGSCPAPISLNLGIISQTVEVSYQPFCDFLAMIRPLVIAGAWLISAFMYVGVLRRG